MASKVDLADRLAALGNLRAFVDLARERWELGLAGFLLVADGQRRAFQTESARLLVERQRLDNHIDLILALGGGFDTEEEGVARP